jgi:hypothetical protein
MTCLVGDLQLLSCSNVLRFRYGSLESAESLAVELLNRISSQSIPTFTTRLKPTEALVTVNSISP